MRRALAARVPQRVREDEPSFGVRVRDLDRLAVRGAQDVARPERVAADEILRRGDDRDDPHGQLELRDRGDACDHGRAAGHVALHVLHLQRRLERDPAGVERDRLADEPEHDSSLSPVRRLVAEDDQAGPVRARASDGRERAHAELIDLLGLRALRREVRPASSAARSASTSGVSSFGGELARSRAAFTQLPTRAVRPRGLREPVGGVGVEDDLLDALPRLLLRLPAGRAVGPEHRPFDDRPCLVVEGQGERLVEQPRHGAADVGQPRRTTAEAAVRSASASSSSRLPTPATTTRRAFSSPSVWSSDGPCRGRPSARRRRPGAAAGP